MIMERFEDPNDPLNGPKYRTGKDCIEPGCNNPAGTHWSRHWCQPCNAKRFKQIGATLEHEVARLDGRVPPNSLPPHQQ